MECNWCYEETTGKAYLNEKAFCRKECLLSYAEFESQFTPEEVIPEE